ALLGLGEDAKVHRASLPACTRYARTGSACRLASCWIRRRQVPRSTFTPCFDTWRLVCPQLLPARRLRVERRSKGRARHTVCADRVRMSARLTAAHGCGSLLAGEHDEAVGPEGEDTRLLTAVEGRTVSGHVPHLVRAEVGRIHLRVRVELHSPQ